MVALHRLGAVGLCDSSGILKKWGDKYGIKIELTLVNDYVESINLYTAGKFDACAMTNMDALTIPAVGGIDSEAVIVGDFSNGNDGIVMKKGNSVKALKGRTVNLVELTVSHYLLARALDMNGMSERDVKLVNTSDSDIAAVFTADVNGAAVTWNPPLMQARAAKGATLVFDSSQIPGEIMDLMVVKTSAPDSLKKALTGAWYEVMALMTASGAPQMRLSNRWPRHPYGCSVLQVAARHHGDVLRAGERRGLCHLGRCRQDDGPCAPILFQQGIVRTECEEHGRRRHRTGGRYLGQQGQT